MVFNSSWLKSPVRHPVFFPGLLETHSDWSMSHIKSGQITVDSSDWSLSDSKSFQLSNKVLFCLKSEPHFVSSDLLDSAGMINLSHMTSLLRSLRLYLINTSWLGNCSGPELVSILHLVSPENFLGQIRFVYIACLCKIKF